MGADQITKQALELAAKKQQEQTKRKIIESSISLSGVRLRCRDGPTFRTDCEARALLFVDTVQALPERDRSLHSLLLCHRRRSCAASSGCLVLFCTFHRRSFVTTRFGFASATFRPQTC